jgi:PPM family protein phosphatase
VGTRYEAAGCTDRGQVRLGNEDAFMLHLGENQQTGDFVVCDGMGGAAAGELASRVAAEAMLRAMSAEVLTSELMERAVSVANASVYALAQSDPALQGMGTTLVALAARNQNAWIAHAGDSRCYRLRGGSLERLTRDHSLVDEQVRQGLMTPAQAAVSPLRNVITRAVGTESEIAADVLAVDVAESDLYLLTSDGLVRELSDERIREIVSRPAPLAERCADLIGAANQAGGGDNITCVLVAARASLP